jgi:ribonuclease VapC
MTKYLFDSYALLALFQGEEGADAVAQILRKALRRKEDRLLCIINLGEIMYLTKRRFGDAEKIEVISRVHQLGITVLSVSDSLVYQAAEIKAEYAISYADCFALACAMNNAATLVTGDPDFKKVSHLNPIKWIKEC